MTSRILPDIIAIEKPMKRLLTKASAWKRIREIPNSVTKTLLAGSEGIYDQNDHSKGHVSSVHRSRHGSRMVQLCDKQSGSIFIFTKASERDILTAGKMCSITYVVKRDNTRTEFRSG
jgi:hypothetical protein